MILDDTKEIMVPMDTEPKNGDYTGEDGLLYCGVCYTPKEAYFPEGKTLFGRDRHQSECECRRKEREKWEAEERQREHEAAVERLKDIGFTDSSMKRWTFDNDNGRNPQMRFAHIYVEHWEEMRAESRGYLLWGECRHRKDLPCRMYCKCIDGAGGSGTDDELCRYLERSDRHIKREKCIHRAIMQLSTSDTGRFWDGERDRIRLRAGL